MESVLSDLLAVDNLFIHWSAINLLYYALVDIVDSVLSVISDEWYDIEEMLPLKDVPKLIGYNAKTIQRWAHQKTLKTVWHQNHLFTTRDWVIDFLATEGYKVQNKSLLHTRLLLQYYNQ